MAWRGRSRRYGFDIRVSDRDLFLPDPILRQRAQARPVGQRDMPVASMKLLKLSRRENHLIHNSNHPPPCGCLLIANQLTSAFAVTVQNNHVTRSTAKLVDRNYRVGFRFAGVV